MTEIEDKALIKACDDHWNEKYDEAFLQFQTLAESGNTSAMVMLANMYFAGEGCNLDYEQSIAWDKRAIETGDLTPYSNLAITYRAQGDIVCAKYWFEKALATGDNDVALQLAKLYMVSEKETDKVKELLAIVINSEIRIEVCEDSVEEAKEILGKIENK